MWHSNDMFHYMFKAEFVTLVTLKVPSGTAVEKKKHPWDTHSAFLILRSRKEAILNKR